jgi:hypothetical protein
MPTLGAIEGLFLLQILQLFGGLPLKFQIQGQFMQHYIIGRRQ